MKLKFLLKFWLKIQCHNRNFYFKGFNVRMSLKFFYYKIKLSI